MHHQASPADRLFREDFISGGITPAQFDHRAHVRLAFVLLTESGIDEAVGAMRSALHAFLAHHRIDTAKYHETMTRAWILAVRHFMDRTKPCTSADEFIDSNPMLLDTRIMLTHYSAALLFSPEARSAFIEPDIQPIPRPL